MRKLIKLILLLVIFIFTQNTQAFADCNILVLPDDIDFESTNYYIYPDTSVLFASDIVNELKKRNLSIVSMAEIRDSLRKNSEISKLTASALKEFKYNYNIPFVDFKPIAKHFNTNMVLLITSQTDTQSYLLRHSLWDFLNVPGTTPIDPMYKLSTYIALVDVDNEYVVWDKTYYKKVASMEGRIIPHNFAPATEQLHKIKAYSKNNLSPLVASIVEAKILPPVAVTAGVPKNYNVVKSLRTNVLPYPVNYVHPKRSLEDSVKQTVHEYVMVPSNKPKKAKGQKFSASSITTKIRGFVNNTKNNVKTFIDNAAADEPYIDNKNTGDFIDYSEESPINYDDSTEIKPKQKPNYRPSNDDYGVMMNAL